MLMQFQVILSEDHTFAVVADGFSSKFDAAMFIREIQQALQLVKDFDAAQAEADAIVQPDHVEAQTRRGVDLLRCADSWSWRIMIRKNKKTMIQREDDVLERALDFGRCIDCEELLQMVSRHGGKMEFRVRGTIRYFPDHDNYKQAGISYSLKVVT